MKVYRNNIEWELVQGADGWWSIYEIKEGKRIPHYQAKDYEHAMNYVDKCERPDFPLIYI